MDVTPSELRTTELREAWRGYRQDDVDHLLDRVSGTIERLQGQVQRLSERVAEAESEAGLGREADEMLRRTLLLAQRTADAAVAEAQDRARRVLSESEAHAHSIVSGAEEEARRIAIAERHRVENEIQELIAKRDVLVADVGALEQTARDHRRRLKDFLDAELARIESRPIPEPATPTPTSVEERIFGDPVSEPDEYAPSESVDAAMSALPAPRAEVDLAAEEAGEASDATGPPSAPDERPDERPDEERPEERAAAWDEVPLDEPADSPVEGPIDGPGDLLPAKKRRWRLRENDLDPEPPTDEFFRDLRQAVADDKPLGPRDELSDPGMRPESPPPAARSEEGPDEEAGPEGVPHEQFAAAGPAFFDQDEPRRRS